MRSFIAGCLGVFCLLVAVLLLPRQSCAQAISTASRSLDIAGFGGYSGAYTDYGNTRDQGAAFGVDVTRFFHLPVYPSLEVRANMLHGTVIDEDSYLGGLRAEYPLAHRLHPYADILVGFGTLHFKFTPSPGYTGDRSVVLSYGGGVDIDIIRNLQLKIDAQYQNWKLGPNGTNVTQTGNFNLTPTVGIIGVEYHIPFRPFIKQRDFYH
jgi:hypothetical protein